MRRLAFVIATAALVQPQPAARSADGCCLTIGQVNDLKLKGGTGISWLEVDHCLTDGATKLCNNPDLKGFEFTDDCAVGVKKPLPLNPKPGEAKGCINWGAVAKKKDVRLFYNGEPTKDVDKFSKRLQEKDVVVLLLRSTADKQGKVRCELVEIRAISSDKLAK